MIKVEVQTVEACRRRLHIEVPAEETRKEYESVLRLFLAQGSLPGFRKGRAPRHLIERQYGKSIDEEFRRQVLSRAYREALRQEKLSVAAMVGVENVNLNPTTGLSCDVAVDLLPEFELPDYKAIPVKRVEIQVSDEALENHLNGIRERLADFVETDPGHAAAEGDIVQADFQGFLDGQPIATGVPDAGLLGGATDQWVLVGNESMLVPGMNGVLAGATAGDVREFDTTFGDEVAPEALRGRTAHYTATIKAVRKRQMPALDEAFCKRLGVESPEALRDMMRQRLLQEAELQDEGRRRGEVSDYLLQHTVFDLPQSVVEQEMRTEIQHLVQESLRSGIDREKIAQEQAALVDAARSMAQRRLRLTYILLRIAEAEEIKASAHEVTARLERMAHARNLPVEKMRAEVESRYGMEALDQEICANKAMTWLLAHVQEA